MPIIHATTRHPDDQQVIHILLFQISSLADPTRLWDMATFFILHYFSSSKSIQLNFGNHIADTQQGGLSKQNCWKITVRCLTSTSWLQILTSFLNYLISLHYVILHYITLNYITLHYNHIHFTDAMFVSRQLNTKKVTDIHKMTHTGFIKGHINRCKNIK